jgi:hypothetical protein
MKRQHPAGIALGIGAGIDQLAGLFGIPTQHLGMLTISVPA